MRDALERAGAPAAKLKLELTESLIIDDIEGAIEKMRALKRLGVGFSMDDFGTGYSSLSYLTRLPLDQLKIDRSFVRNLPDSANDAAVVQTIITLAKSLGLAVIAEGVETEAQRRVPRAATAARPTKASCSAPRWTSRNSSGCWLRRPLARAKWIARPAFVLPPSPPPEEQQ